jgi:hypothetical protein
VTRARVIPAWLDACFPDAEPMAGERAITCNRCRRGWLAVVEDAARPLVTTMVAGRPLVLDRHNQCDIALWAATTIMKLQVVRDPALVSPAACRQLREERRPPTGFRIAVAMRPREGRWPYRFAAHGSPGAAREFDVQPTFSDTELGRYHAELCAGHLVVAASARFTPAAEQVQHDWAWSEIWPARTPVRWPAARGLVRTAAPRVAA